MTVPFNSNSKCPLLLQHYWQAVEGAKVSFLDDRIGFMALSGTRISFQMFA